MENEAKQDIDQKKEIVQAILGRLAKIRQYSDMISPMIEKEVLTAMDVSAAFDLADELQVESEEIIQALFDLRDIIGPDQQQG